MTRGVKEQPDPALRRWAAAELNFAESISADQARLKFWRCIESEWDFSPPTTWHDAASIIAAAKPTSGGDRSLSSDAIRALHAQQRDAVEQFAAAFFTFSPLERKQRWNQLQERCADIPHLMGRLNFLAVGLDVEVPSLVAASKSTSEFSDEILRMFVLRPAERVHARQAVIARSKEDPAAWESVVRELTKCAPAVAELEPALTAELLTWKTRAKVRKSNLAARRKAPQPATSQSSGSSLSSAAIVIVIVSVVSGLMSLSKSPSQNQSLNWSQQEKLHANLKRLHLHFDPYVQYLHAKRDARARGDFQEMYDPEAPSGPRPPAYVGDAMLMAFGYRDEYYELQSHLREQRARKAFEEHHGASTAPRIEESPDAP